MTRVCQHCKGQVREVYGGTGYIGPVGETLYWYLHLAEAKEPVSLAPNAWMCDACHLAGTIPPPLTPEEERAFERRWAEIAATRDDAPFWRSTVTATSTPFSRNWLIDMFLREQR